MGPGEDEKAGSVNWKCIQTTGCSSSMDGQLGCDVSKCDTGATDSDDDGGFPLKYVESRLPYYEAWHGDVRIQFEQY